MPIPSKTNFKNHTCQCHQKKWHVVKSNDEFLGLLGTTFKLLGAVTKLFTSSFFKHSAFVASGIVCSGFFPAFAGHPFLVCLLSSPSLLQPKVWVLCCLLFSTWIYFWMISYNLVTSKFPYLVLTYSIRYEVSNYLSNIYSVYYVSYTNIAKTEFLILLPPLKYSDLLKYFF